MESPVGSTADDSVATGLSDGQDEAQPAESTDVAEQEPEAPAAPAHEPADGVGGDTEVGNWGQPGLTPAAQPLDMGKISEEGRALLREGMASLGLGRQLGNDLADWLDKHPTAQVSISGKTPEPALIVHSTPDEDPVLDRAVPFGPTEG